jgi:tyrosyl-tRNA synthetase
MEQIFTVLDPNKTEVRYQSEWFSKVGLSEVISWAAQTTVAKLISHDTFKQRLENNLPLSLHEMFYPVLQGIDSVYVNADVELGGSDQKFNVLMGRDYQRARGKRPQVAMLLPIILGTDGVQKMSKSLGNYIGILDLAFDKFGKIMSIPDHLMPEYYQYVANATEEEVQKIKQQLKSGELHPNEAKKQLASKVVSFFHGESEGPAMRTQFESVFAKGQLPDEVPEFTFIRGEHLVSILVDSKMLSSKTEGKRLIAQGGLSVMDGAKISDIEIRLDESYAGKVLKIGKRKFLKLV